MKKAGRVKSAGAIVYRDTTRGRVYLLLRNVRGHWDFPKGKVEPGETRNATICRETSEECGISKLDFHPFFLKICRWSYREGGAPVWKTAVFRLARTDEVRLRLSAEHSQGVWLPIARALARVHFPNQRNLLRTADKILRSRAAGKP
jgi:8-oxo-dGTP pyrophosphatase MutT (NUDIX family)